MLFSTLEYASYLSYSPHGSTQPEINSRNAMIMVKNDVQIASKNMPTTEYIAQKIANNLSKLPFKDFFGNDISLVPVPKSSPIKHGTLWVPHRMVQALCRLNLGKELNCLRRIQAVPKSATSKPSERPTAKRHYETISVQDVLNQPKAILLVDDVITRGATFIGSASRLHDVFPDIPIRAFAILRTVSNPSEFTKIESPIVGKIDLMGDQTFRYP